MSTLQRVSPDGSTTDSSISITRVSPSGSTTPITVTAAGAPKFIPESLYPQPLGIGSGMGVP
jgi:hypothetical protein